MALNPHLHARLKEVAERQRCLRLRIGLASAWGSAAFLGLLIALLGGSSWFAQGAVVFTAGLLAAVFFRKAAQPPDWRALALEIEAKHPDLEGLLLTAVQQDAGDMAQSSYLQRRLLRDTLYHAAIQDWQETVPRSRLGAAQTAHFVALLFLGLVLWQLRSATPPEVALVKQVSNEVTVTPGDASIEKGSSLVVLVQFRGRLPASVELVADVAGTTRRLALNRSLADPVFGGVFPDPGTNFSYRVEYAGKRSRDFRVEVFEYPRLERADANLKFPAYTGLEPKLIPDTRRISAVEGAELSMTLLLNKPVAGARLVPRVPRAKDAAPLALAPKAPQPLAILPPMELAETGTYDLQLTDLDGRTNKVAANFVIHVLKNKTPEMRLDSPRGDVRRSRKSLSAVRFSTISVFAPLAWVIPSPGLSRFTLLLAATPQPTKSSPCNTCSGSKTSASAPTSCSAGSSGLTTSVPMANCGAPWAICFLPGFVPSMRFSERDRARTAHPRASSPNPAKAAIRQPRSRNCKSRSSAPPGN
jgi:hypothetical protein